MLDGSSLASNSSHMLEDNPQCCPFVKDLIMYVSVGQMLMGLPYLHLTLWLLSDMCCKYKGSLPQSVRQWQRTPEHLQCRSTSNGGKNGQVVVFQRVYQSMPYLFPKSADFLVHLFRVGMAWCTTGIYHSAL